MHQAKDLTWKQERFVSEYLLSGNAAEAVRRAGYQTRYPSEFGYGLKRHLRVRTALIKAQEARASAWRFKPIWLLVSTCS